jgi:hypothetical protein
MQLSGGNAVKSNGADGSENARAFEAVAVGAAKPDLKDPRVVMSLLEADQVVAAKQKTRFGRRDLSFGVRILLWALRVYVVIMLLLVVISVFRAIHPAQ